MSESDQPGGSTPQISTQMTKTVGQLDNFDPNKEHWECYFERFEQITVMTNGMSTRGNGSIDVWRPTKPCLPGKAQR